MSEIEEPTQEFKCPECGKTFANAKGLAGHMRLSHQYPAKQDGYAKYVDGVMEKQEALTDKQMEAISKQIEGLRKHIEALESSKEATESRSSSNQATIKREDAIEHIKKCPDCYDKVKGIILKDCEDEVMRKVWRERMNLDQECYACGFPVKKEDAVCPICGGAKAKSREDGMGYDESTWVLKEEAKEETP